MDTLVFNTQCGIKTPTGPLYFEEQHVLSFVLPEQVFRSYNLSIETAVKTLKLVFVPDIPQQSKIETRFLQSSNSCDLLAKFSSSIPGLYYFSISGLPGVDQQTMLTINPRLKLSSGETVSITSLSMTTLISTMLGKLEDWKHTLKPVIDGGYNLIHFTPLQPTGESGSVYSLHSWESYSRSLGGSSISRRQRLTDNINKLWRKQGVFSMTDLVLNHLAPSSPLLRRCSSAAYTTTTHPHLAPAAVLDMHVVALESAICRGLHPKLGRDVGTLNAHQQHLWLLFLRAELDNAVEHLALHEFEQLDATRVLMGLRGGILSDLLSAAQRGAEESRASGGPIGGDLMAQIWKAEPTQLRGVRFGATLDVHRFGELVGGVLGINPGEDELVRLTLSYVRHHNQECRQRTGSDLGEAVDNIVAAAKYHLFESPERPADLAAPDAYVVSRGFRAMDPKVEEKVLLAIKHHGGYSPGLSELSKLETSVWMACNGWVMGPAVDFTTRAGRYFLRRQVITWGDCVKLNYGTDAVPAHDVWAAALHYVETMAGIFHGFRIDNAHSTPPKLLREVIRAVRSICPDAFFMMEIFSGDRARDHHLTQWVGANSMVQELVHCRNCSDLCAVVGANTSAVGDMQPPQSVSVPVMLHDFSHDNELPGSRLSHHRSGNFLALAASAMSGNFPCATVRGVDEGISQRFSVSEQKVYPATPESRRDLIAVRACLCDAHAAMADQMTQCYTHNHGVLFTTARLDPISGRSVIFVIRPDFGDTSSHQMDLLLPGMLENVILLASPKKFTITEQLSVTADESAFIAPPDESLCEVQCCRSLSEELQEDLGLRFGDELQGVEVLRGNLDFTLRIDLGIFTPGSVMAVLTNSGQYYKDCMHPAFGPSLQEELLSLTHRELTSFLGTAAQDESRLHEGWGAYSFQKDGQESFTPMVVGFDGISLAVSRMTLDSSISDNIRRGCWLFDYIHNRATRDGYFHKLPIFFTEMEHLRSVPPYLRPRAFKAFVDTVDEALNASLLARSGISPAHGLAAPLLRSTYHLVTYIAEAATVDPNVIKTIHHSLPTALQTPALAGLASRGYGDVSIPAGFPHFVEGCFRNWGRDTAIAITGLLTVPGRQEDARDVILSLGALLRHGLVPNLLDGGRNPRFNCRDAVWWWLHALQCYCERWGPSLLATPMLRVFPSDHKHDYHFDQPNYTWVLNDTGRRGEHVTTLAHLVWEALERHLRGISFREWNAGHAIDSKMKSEGFNVNVEVDSDTGLIFGGNPHNCGTWMDKMGECHRHGTVGQPATPRVGADVEIIGLAHAALGWLSLPAVRRMLPHGGEFPGQAIASVSDWHKKIGKSFDHCFYIPQSQSADTDFAVDGGMIRTRGHHKDTYSAPYSHPNLRADHQLRPNLFFAFAASPTLGTKARRDTCLKTAFARLTHKGSAGMATLVPEDPVFRPFYSGSESGDPLTSCGFSYHNGPGWVHVTGAALVAAARSGLGSEIPEVGRVIWRIRELLDRQSSVRSLPELVQYDGTHCDGSCVSQAWAVGCVLHGLKELFTVQ